MAIITPFSSVFKGLPLASRVCQSSPWQPVNLSTSLWVLVQSGQKEAGKGLVLGHNLHPPIENTLTQNTNVFFPELEVSSVHGSTSIIQTLTNI